MKPVDHWRAGERFKKDYGHKFEDYAWRHWLDIKASEINLNTLHRNWVCHSVALGHIGSNQGYRLYIILKDNFSAFLDDLRDGIIQDRFP